MTGYSAKALDGINYDLSNAVEVVTNQQVLVLDQSYSTNTFEFTTNTFQAFDVAITNGVNTFTLHARDLAGNVTTTNFSFTLDYSGKTNPPSVQVNWPQSGVKVCGTSFTCNGLVGDPTATVTVQLVGTNGVTNIMTAAVGRGGDFWAQNLPLGGGTNWLALTAVDVVGNVMVTNMTIVQGDIGLNVDSVSAGQTVVTGEIGATNDTVWVNGAKATNNGDGTWTAQIKAIEVGGGVVEALAVPDSDNGGNGSGGADAAGNPGSSQAQGVQPVVAAPSGIYVSKSSASGVATGPDVGYPWYYDYTWEDGKGGSGHSTLSDTGIELDTYTWAASWWPEAPPTPTVSAVYLSDGIPGYADYSLFSLPAGSSPPTTTHQQVDETDVNGNRTVLNEDGELKLATGGPMGSHQIRLYAIGATMTRYGWPWMWE